MSVLGAMLANRVDGSIKQGLSDAGIPTSGASTTSNLNLDELPPLVQEIVRGAYGDATGHIFLVSVAIGLVGLVAAIALKPIILRSSLDLEKKPVATVVGRGGVLSRCR